MKREELLAVNAAAADYTKDYDHQTGSREFAFLSGVEWYSQYMNVKKDIDAVDAVNNKKETEWICIDEQCYKRDQSWYYHSVIKVNGQSLKVEIRRNAYDIQSYANVSRWDGKQWSIVWKKPINACNCKSVSYLGKATVEDFAADAFDLYHTCLKIIA
jgi:hypothetical protein